MTSGSEGCCPDNNFILRYYSFFSVSTVISTFFLYRRCTAGRPLTGSLRRRGFARPCVASPARDLASFRVVSIHRLLVHEPSRRRHPPPDDPSVGADGAGDIVDDAQRSLEYDTVSETYGRFLLEDILPVVRSLAPNITCAPPCSSLACPLSQLKVTHPSLYMSCDVQRGAFAACGDGHLLRRDWCVQHGVLRARGLRPSATSSATADPVSPHSLLPPSCPPQTPWPDPAAACSMMHFPTGSDNTLSMQM